MAPTQKPRVLVSDKLSETAVNIFRNRGVEVDFQPDLGKDKDALTLVSEDISANTIQVNLDAVDTTYYWKVVVQDDKGALVTGPIWYFNL